MTMPLSAQLIATRTCVQDVVVANGSEGSATLPELASILTILHVSKAEVNEVVLVREGPDSVRLQALERHFIT